MPALAHKLIIDTDAGADDLLALNLAFSKASQRISAIIGSYGNFTLDGSMKRIESFIENWRKTSRTKLTQFPIVAGSSRPLHNSYAEFEGRIHGPSPVNPPSRNSSWRDKLFGPSWMNELNTLKGPCTYVSLGPLTNLAHLTKYPMWSQISDIVVMGGTLFFPGNATPASEANIWWDPEAFEVVLKAANQSNKPVYLVPLNMTEKVQLSLVDAKKRNLLKLIPGLKEYIHYYVTIKKYYLDPHTFEKKLYKGGALHDVVAMEVALKGKVVHPTEVFLNPDFLSQGVLLPQKRELNPRAPKVFLP